MFRCIEKYTSGDRTVPMRRFIATALVLVLAAAAGAQEDRVQLTGVVRDAGGELLNGVVVTAAAGGAGPVRTLTNRDGRFELLLLPGLWTVTAARLGGDELASQEVRLRDGQPQELELVAGSSVGRHSVELSRVRAQERERRPPFSLENPQGEATVSQEFDPGLLESGGMRAAVELSLLTNSVLLQARQRIMDQLASNRYNVSFWLDAPTDDGSEVGAGAGIDGNASEPLLSAEGRYESDSFRLGVDWSQHYLGATGLGQRSWVGSVLAESSMMIGVPVQVTFGLRYDHFEYLDNPDHLSPSAEVVYRPGGGTTLHGRVSYEAIAPRGELGTVVIGEESLDAERRLGYELGVSQRLGDDTELTFRAFYNEVRNHIVNLYRPLRDAYTREVINAGDGVVRGVEFGVEKVFLNGLRGTVNYTYSEADGLDIRSVNLHFEDIQDFERFLELGLRRDLSTTVEAFFGSTGTRVQAVYRVYLADLEDDVGFSEGITSLLVDHSRLDLNLTQRIDFGLLSNARISFNFAVNNLLNNLRNSIFLSNDTDLVNRPRTIIGGIRIEF